MTRRILPALLALALAACGTDSPDPAAPAPPAAQTTQAPARDAKAIADALKAAGLPLTAVAAQDEDTDPNNKLGRPGGYTSRASADVPGGDKQADKYSISRGLVVEVFPAADEADARAKYIQDSLKANPILGLEWHYRPADRRVLVRLAGGVKPSLAKKFETAVGAL